MGLLKACETYIKRRKVNLKLIRNKKLQKKYPKLSQTQLKEHLLIIYVCFFIRTLNRTQVFFRLYESGLTGVECILALKLTRN